MNSFNERLLSLLKDNLFLALCVLYSASAGFSLISLSFPILNILMTIFLWLLFDQGRKGVAAPNYIRCISGTIFASYVVNWVLYCALAFCGVLFIVMGSFLGSAGVWDIVYSEIAPYLGPYRSLFSAAAGFFFLAVAIAFFIIAAAGILINLFGRRSIHRFVQSVYQGMECGQVNLVKCHTARIWLMVFGILNGVGALSGFTSWDIRNFLAEGSQAAALIIGSVLVGKYFDGGDQVQA